jgi:hypothetical protein
MPNIAEILRIQVPQLDLTENVYAAGGFTLSNLPTHSALRFRVHESSWFSPQNHKLFKYIFFSYSLREAVFDLSNKIKYETGYLCCFEEICCFLLHFCVIVSRRNIFPRNIDIYVPHLPVLTSQTRILY